MTRDTVDLEDLGLDSGLKVLRVGCNFRFNARTSHKCDTTGPSFRAGVWSVDIMISLTVCAENYTALSNYVATQISCHGKVDW